jgi:hypothetical protein
MNGCTYRPTKLSEYNPTEKSKYFGRPKYLIPLFWQTDLKTETRIIRSVGFFPIFASSVFGSPLTF